ncbi:MAG: FecR family protein [Bacteroidales bacterium]
MEKLILKYLSGKATSQEKERVRKWTIESEENMNMFIRLKNLNVTIMTPDKEATDQEADTFINSLKKPSKTEISTKRNIYKSFLYLISGAAAIAIIALILSINSYKGQNENLNQQLEFINQQQISYHENSTPFGVKGKVILPDSSVVWLNSGSSIHYPSKFHGENREIDFSGEGYFEVKPNANFPMRITLKNGMSVFVRGTSFNLSSYDNDKSVSLLLISGKVSMVDKEKREFATLKPNDKLMLDKETNSFRLIRPQDHEPTVGWKKGWLIFDESPMPDIIKKLERWYGVNIDVADNEVLGKTLTAKFREESLSQVLDLMHRISLINYTIKDSTALLSNFSMK